MGKLLILGAGGHGRVVAEAAALEGRWEAIAFLDDIRKDSMVDGLPVLGGLVDYRAYIGDYGQAAVAIGDNAKRLEWLERLCDAGYGLPVIVHPKAAVSPRSQVGQGTVILAGAVVNPGVVLGEGCIVNIHAAIDHDCRIGKGVHIATGANLRSMVTVGDTALIGAGACLASRARVGPGAVVNEGAVVIEEIEERLG